MMPKSYQSLFDLYKNVANSAQQMPTLVNKGVSKIPQNNQTTSADVSNHTTQQLSHKLQNFFKAHTLREQEEIKQNDKIDACKKPEEPGESQPQKPCLQVLPQLLVKRRRQNDEQIIIEPKNERYDRDNWVHKPGKTFAQGVNVNSSIYNDVLQPQFVSLFVGRPGSGKTFMIEELLLNDKLYFGKFDKILIFAPNKLPTLLCEDTINYFPTIEPAFMSEKLYEIGRENPKANVVLVIDDSIMNVKHLGNDKIFMSLIWNRRHFIPQGTVSFMISTQKYVAAPTNLRSALTSIYVFPVQGRDWEQIFRETVPGGNIRRLNPVIQNHWKRPHNFVYINMDKGEVWLNFKLQLNVQNQPLV